MMFQLRKQDDVKEIYKPAGAEAPDFSCQTTTSSSAPGTARDACVVPELKRNTFVVSLPAKEIVYTAILQALDSPVSIVYRMYNDRNFVRLKCFIVLLLATAVDIF
jgi:hypothetical protein